MKIRITLILGVLLAVVFPAGARELFALNLQVPAYTVKSGTRGGNHVAEVLPFSSSAPEPNTLVLLLGGVTGMVWRFARRSFEEIKRLFDIVLSIVGLTVSLPILLYAMFMIKIDSSGPVIYSQRRVGKDGRVFRIYKLRTMRQDAEKLTGAVWAHKNDPRITPVGSVLRKLRLDEIPQFCNVLRGEMSIIGPRPERPEIATKLRDYICEYDSRLKVKPGITGLAQVFYKYDETLEDVKNKIKFDKLYLQSMSFVTDMKILARTFLVVVTGKGAQ